MCALNNKQFFSFENDKDTEKLEFRYKTNEQL